MRQDERALSVRSSKAQLGAWLQSRFARWLFSAPLAPAFLPTGGEHAHRVAEARARFDDGAELVLSYANASPNDAAWGTSAAIETGARPSLWTCASNATATSGGDMLARRSCMLIDVRALARDEEAGAIILLGVEPDLRAGMMRIAMYARRIANTARNTANLALDDAATVALQRDVETIFREHAFAGALLVDAIDGDGSQGGAAAAQFGRAILSASRDDERTQGTSTSGIESSHDLDAPTLQPLAFYEVLIVDEHEAPVAGVKVTMQTPLGTVTKPTGGDGRVRVDDAPPGSGSASIASVAGLREVLAGRETTPRRMKPLPTAGDWTFRTLSGATASLQVPSGITRRLMIVTRLDFYSAGDLPTWGAIRATNEGPWQLTHADAVRLNVHADATGLSPSVVGDLDDPDDDDANAGANESEAESAGEGAANAPPAESPAPWITMDTNALHDALFSEDLTGALGIVAAQPLDPPDDLDPTPPPVAEQVAFSENVALAALNGDVDVPFPVFTEDENPHLEVAHVPQSTRDVA